MRRRPYASIVVNEFSPSQYAITVYMSAGTRSNPFGARVFPIAASLYTCLVAVATWKHTFWRDETEAWLIARDSHSLTALLHNVRYEGHPPLWNLVLYCITCFTANPDWMKLPNFLFSVAAACMILSARQVPAWVRVGFVFSYFMLFEFAVIDRNYMIGLMFLVAAVTLLKNDKSGLKIPFALSLAALSSLPALMISFCLYPFHLLPVLAAAKPRTPGDWWRALGLRRILALGFFLACSLCALAVIHPPADSGLLLETGVKDSLLHRFKIGSMAVAYLPIPSNVAGFWDTSILIQSGHHVSTILGIALAISLPFFFRRKFVRYFFVISSGLFLIEMAISGRYFMRHVGWLFILFILAIILDYADEPPPITADRLRKSPWRSALLAAILIAQAGTGLFAIAVGMRYPFSASRQVAAFLREQHLDHAPMVSEPDFVAQSVLAYLQRPSAYYLERHGLGSIIIWNRDEYLLRHVPSRQELLSASQNGNSPVLITEDPLTAQQIAELQVNLLAAFTGTNASSDRYYIYRSTSSLTVP
jgi:hypothetical protein